MAKRKSAPVKPAPVKPHPTPRPWKAVQCRLSKQWWIERRVDGYKAAIAQVGIGNEPNAYGGTAEEDAKFIVRACTCFDKLLAACKEALNRDSEMHPAGCDCELCLELRNAIFLAEEGPTDDPDYQQAEDA